MAHEDDSQRRAVEAASTLGSDAIANVCGALAHQTRVMVLAALVDGRASPARIARIHGRTVAAMSHHFRTLERAGLLRRAGTRPNRGTIEHFYALTPRGEAVVELLASIAAAMAPGRRRRPEAA